VPSPKRRRRGGQSSPRRGLAQPPMVALEDPASRPKAAARGFRCRSGGASFALRPHPPKWAGVRARRNLTEQPTSRLCSADESVVTSRRCQRPATRSFHGLCFPFKVPQLPLHPGDALPESALPSGRSPPSRRPASPRDSELPRRRVDGIPPRVHPARLPPKRWARRTTWGAEAESRATPFQRRGGSPLSRPGLLPRPKSRSGTRAVPPEYVRILGS
jgi:hypothetical protein